MLGARGDPCLSFGAHPTKRASKMTSFITTVVADYGLELFSRSPEAAAYISPSLHKESCRNQRTRNQFRPRNATKGTSSYQLRQYAEATLGGGSLRKIVKLPEGEDENEWLAVNMVDFYNHINLLYGSITEFCSPQSCPEMKATDEFEYLWQDSENYKRPTKMPAPTYIEHLMVWVQSNIDNEAVFPSRIGVPFPKSFPSMIRQVFKRMYRVASMRLGTGRQDLENLGVAGQQPSNLFPTTTSTPRRHSIAVIKMNVSRAFVRAANTSATRVTIARRAAAQPAIRSYATPASSADTKPPVALYGLDGTYASALYTAAVKSQSLETVAKALSSLQEIYVKDPKLSNIMQAPTLTTEDKSAIIAELQKHTGGQDKADTVKNFLNTLAENNRLALLEGVCTKFGELMGAARGEIELTVTSATPLDNKTLTRLESAVAKSQYVGQGKKLKVTNKVNSDILGGLVVEIGDRTIDLSVSSRISKMNKLLTDTL
ncbi:hypothetical protein V502_06905 [Pseudogymnoascus sp. VKM F-4520 (FW-2644)]|nr:hypothetical protein V502_06905 [Pseudogymnoascus sp. VKM F-4520 (FW-2644)]